MFIIIGFFQVKCLISFNNEIMHISRRETILGFELKTIEKLPETL